MSSLSTYMAAMLLLTSVALAPDVIKAQSYYQQQCTNVENYQGRCAETRCCPQRQQQIQSISSQPAGVFAAPAQAGEVVGESNGFGIRGMSFTLPAITFELPSIRMPSFFRTRRDAHMRMDAANAPFVQGQPTFYGQLATTGVQLNNMSQVHQPTGEKTTNDFCSESESCTSDDMPFNETGESAPTGNEPKRLPLPEMGALTPRERVLLLELLKERQRLARLESQMKSVSRNNAVNLYTLQDANSLFDASQQEGRSLEPAKSQQVLEHPWASSSPEIQHAQFVEGRRSRR